MTSDRLNEIKKNYKVIEIAVDFINPSYNISRAKRLDNSRYIVCTLTENGVPRKIKTNETARIRLQKPDKTYVYNDCEPIEDGRVLITLTEQILASEGNAVCDIQLTNEDSGIIYSTKNFIISIDKTAVDNSVIESSDEFDALNNLIASNKKLNDEINADEKLRQSSESARQNNETDRENAEAERSEAETARTANENERIISENIRKENEADRQADTAAAVANAENAANKADAAADGLQDKLDSHHFVLTEDKGTAGGVAKLDANSKVPISELYAATISDKGITQLTDSITSISTTTAATANSVKTAYEESKSYTDSKITDLINSGELGSTDISEQLAKKVDKDGGIAAANSLQVAALAGGAAIAEGTDLDTLTIPGTYASASSAVSATLLHCPISSSGFVMYTLATYPYQSTVNYRTQIIICSSSTPSSFWIRNINGSGKWCGWVQMKYTDPTDITGNAGTATKLATARNINGILFDGNADRTNYAVCSTDGATAEKTVACAGFTPSLGAEIVVYFKNANTAANPTLNVGGTGAKPIYYHGKAVPTAYLAASRIVALRSTGSAYSVVGEIDAPQLATARNINGMSFDGSEDIRNFAQCNTAAAVAEKTVGRPGFNLVVGAEITVWFTAANTAANPTLNVNNTGAKSIYYRGGNIPASYLKANGVYTFRYNGAVYYLVGDIDTNTTYANMTAATASAAGKEGLVPAPAAGKQASFLRGDGIWATPTNTTYANMTGATASAAGKAGLVPAPAASAVKYALYSNGAWLRPYIISYGSVTTTSKAFTPPYTNTPYDILFILSAYLTFASTGSFYGAVSFYLPNISTSMSAVSETNIAGSSTGIWKYSVTKSGVVTITSPHTPWQYSVLCMPR